MYRSFPITVLTNIPYNGVLVGVNEGLKERFIPPVPRALTENGSGGNSNADLERHMEETRKRLPMYLALAGISSGIAAMFTQPLDVIKTRLQTQNCVFAPGTDKNAIQQSNVVQYRGFVQAGSRIFREEGPGAFFKGTLPRVCVCIPAAAISWSSYEMLKAVLLRYG